MTYYNDGEVVTNISLLAFYQDYQADMNAAVASQAQAAGNATAANGQDVHYNDAKQSEGFWSENVTGDAITADANLYASGTTLPTQTLTDTWVTAPNLLLAETGVDAALQSANNVYGPSTLLTGAAIGYAMSSSGMKMAMGARAATMDAGAIASEIKMASQLGRGITNFGNGLTVVGAALSDLTLADQLLETGTAKTSTAVDASISSTIAAASFFPPTAPFAWVAGAIYGGVRIFYGDQIDNYLDKK